MSAHPPAALAIAVLACAASAQSPANNQVQVFYFQPTTTAQGSQEIVNAIRTIAEIPQISIDAAHKSATFRGTAGQVDMAEWLFQHLDRPSAGAPVPNPVSPEYPVPGTADDMVRVFYPVNINTQTGLAELVNTLRTVGDFPRLFACVGAQATAMRGTAGQTALAGWLVNALDKPEGWQPPAAQNPAAYEYWNGPAPDAFTAVRVFYTAHAETPQALAEVVNLTRTLTDLQRMFGVASRKAVVFRATPNQAALAEWLLNALDKPAAWQPPTNQNPAAYQYQADSPGSTGGTDFVRVFYLAPTVTQQDLQALVTKIRTSAGISRLFANTTHRAVAFRGTASQVSAADQLIAAR
jgi:hypothetical protein